MAVADGELNSGRITPSRPIGVPSPLPSVSLSREHITEAFKKSPDSGATLDLTHKNLTDVGEDGAEELANVGQGEDTGESAVVRYAGYSIVHGHNSSFPPQDCTRSQPSDHSANGLRPSRTATIPRSQEQ